MLEHESSPPTYSEGTISLFPFCTNVQTQYFVHNEMILSKDSRHGLRYLVAKAIHKDASEQKMQNLSEHHISFHTFFLLA